MTISKKTRYAIRALIELGILHNRNKKPVSIQEIASHQQISTRYLENIFHTLVNANILTGLKGKGGGFLPGRPFETISLFDILLILENPGKEFECMNKNINCTLFEQCITRHIWQEWVENMRGFFKKYSLKDLMEKTNQNKTMFHI